MNVLILGASGMIGNLHINKCIDSDKVDKIVYKQALLENVEIIKSLR